MPLYPTGIDELDRLQRGPLASMVDVPRILPVSVGVGSAFRPGAGLASDLIASRGLAACAFVARYDVTHDNGAAGSRMCYRLDDSWDDPSRLYIYRSVSNRREEGLDGAGMRGYADVLSGRERRRLLLDTTEIGRQQHSRWSHPSQTVR
jgi:hypothetical protein